MVLVCIVFIGFIDLIISIYDREFEANLNQLFQKLDKKIEFQNSKEKKEKFKKLISLYHKTRKD